MRDLTPDLFNTDKPWHRPVLDFTPEIVRELCLKNVPEWKNLNPDDLKITRCFAGTINYVFRVSTRIPNELPDVIFRFYDDSFNLIIDRASEVEAFEIASKVGVGPKHLAKIENVCNRSGRIEEYKPGQNPVFKDYTDMNVACLLAKELARFHSMMTPNMQHWPKEPKLIECMNSWMEGCTKFPGYETRFNESELRDEVSQYLSRLDKKVATGRLAFKVMMCHNDPHLFNLLVDDEFTNLTILDYEFIGFNYIGYDLCAYMCEACVDYLGSKEIPFLTVDSQMDYPSDVEEEMVKTYLKGMNVNFDDAFVHQFRQDVKFLEVGWWLARIFFNALL